MRSNQAAKLSFNGITLDGTGATGVLTSGTGDIVDSSGLVSTVNFPSVSLFNGSPGLSTASTSLVDVSGGAVGTITTDRTIRVLIYLTGYMSNSSFISSLAADQVELALYDSFLAASATNVITGGSAITHIVSGGGGAISWTEAESDELVTKVSVLNVAAGTHSYKLQYRAISGGTAFLDLFLTGFMVLGV